MEKYSNKQAISLGRNKSRDLENEIIDKMIFLLLEKERIYYQ